jgi:hypothetical protein
MDVAMNNDCTLSEAELVLVSGGLRDRPDEDHINLRTTIANQGPGTLGSSIYNNQFIGGKTPCESGHPPSEADI